MLGLALPLAAAETPARPHRLLIDHDGHLLFSTLTTNFRADVDEEVREIPANVTTYLLCSGAGRTYFPTKVGRVDPNLKQLIAEHAKGNDPFGYFLEKLKASGRETFVEFRMNDVHNPTDANHWNMPLVREQHPDVIARPEAAARNDPEWLNWSLDFSNPKANAYVTAMLREVVEKYAPVMDGLQMDWMRFPRHLSGVGDEVWAKRAVLTRIVEQTRELTKAHGLKLAVRVPSTLRGCRVLGLDVEDWVKRGLVDFVVVSEFLDTDYTMPIAEFRAKFGPAMPIYASVEIEHGWQFHCPESLRATATGLYDCGADGISLFNFVGRYTFGAVPYDWLTGLESPATAAKKPLLYSLPVNKYRKEMDQPAVLPVSVPAHSTVKLPLPLPGLALPAWRARLLIAADAPLAVTLNGQAVELVPTLHPTEMFVEFIPLANNFSNIGSHRPAREQSHFYRFEAAGLQAGANTLELRNDTDQAIEVKRVNLGLW
ncbi:MAG: hypothetical protein DUW69_001062 [Verrucomicrobia bacterium]|jgi:hypothetical protein|nr:MAG: hypothetical protein DUW69_001062 [Verrucomicrobiota bacterium]